MTHDDIYRGLVEELLRQPNSLAQPIHHQGLQLSAGGGAGLEIMTSLIKTLCH